MKCDTCEQEAKGTFWIAYHKSHEIVEGRISCEECAENDTMFWKGEFRPCGFIPKYFSNDIEKIFNYLDKHGYFKKLIH